MANNLNIEHLHIWSDPEIELGNGKQISEIKESLQPVLNAICLRMVFDEFDLPVPMWKWNIEINQHYKCQCKNRQTKMGKKNK